MFALGGGHLKTLLENLEGSFGLGTDVRSSANTGAGTDLEHRDLSSACLRKAEVIYTLV